MSSGYKSTSTCVIGCILSKYLIVHAVRSFENKLFILLSLDCLQIKDTVWCNISFNKIKPVYLFLIYHLWCIIIPTMIVMYTIILLISVCILSSIHPIIYVYLNNLLIWTRHLTILEPLFNRLCYRDKGDGLIGSSRYAFLS